MLLAIIIIAVAGVTAVFMASVAYSVPKVYWYWTQSRLLGIQQADSTRLIDIHVSDHDKAAAFADLTTKLPDTVNVTKLNPKDTGMYL